MQEGLKELEVLLDPYDWFFEVVAEPRRYVVYVTYMNAEQDVVIPDKVQGKQVVVHFSSSATATAKDFVNPPYNPHMDADLIRRLVNLEEELGPLVPGGAQGGAVARHKKFQEDLDAAAKTMQEIDEEMAMPNLDDLGRKLDKLERQCGPNILFDIFFEVHDRNNAVTNLGNKFPEVLSGMKELYNEYGFDPIYNELEG